MDEDITPQSAENVSDGHYHVLFDTSSLRAAGWADPKNCRIVTFRDTLATFPDISVELVVATPVFDEWRKQFSDWLSQKLRAAKDLNEVLDPSAPAIQLTNDQYRERANEYIRKLGIKVVEPDLSQFDILDMFGRANAPKPRPPFNDKGAGFKDAVIATAMLAYLAEHSDVSLIVVCGDNVFKDYLAEKLGADTTVQVVGDIDEAESNIKLDIKKLGTGLAEEAQSKFYDRDGKKGIFYDLGFGDEVERQYLAEFPDGATAARKCISNRPMSVLGSLFPSDGSLNTHLIPSDASWEPKHSTVEALETVFIDQQGNKLIWESGVSYIKTYNVVVNDPATIAPQVSGIVEHQIFYDVQWSTIKNGAEPFSNPRSGNKITKVSDIFRYYPSATFNPVIRPFSGQVQTISGIPLGSYNAGPLVTGGVYWNPATDSIQQSNNG